MQQQSSSSSPHGTKYTKRTNANGNGIDEEQVKPSAKVNVNVNVKPNANANAKVNAKMQVHVDALKEQLDEKVWQALYQSASDDVSTNTRVHVENHERETKKKLVFGGNKNRTNSNASAIANAMGEKLGTKDKMQSMKASDAIGKSQNHSRNAFFSSAALMFDPQVLPALSQTIDGKVWLRMAQDAERQDDEARMREILKAGLERLPNNPYLLNKLANVEKSKRKYEQARALFRKGVESSPKFLTNYISWANMEQKLRRVESARMVYKMGMKELPHDSELYYKLALLEYNQGNTQLCTETLMHGLKEDCLNPYLNQALAVVEYVQNKNVARANELLHIATSTNPSHVLSWITRATIHEKQGNFQAAQMCYASASTKKGACSALLWLSWIRLEERLGNKLKAIELCELASKRFPDNVDFYVIWGRLLLETGNTILARKTWNKGIQMDPTVGALYLAMGLLEQTLGDFWKARQMFASGVRKTKGRKQAASILYTWATMEMRLGEGNRADKLLKQAQMMDSYHYSNGSSSSSENDVPADESVTYNSASSTVRQISNCYFFMEDPASVYQELSAQSHPINSPEMRAAIENRRKIQASIKGQAPEP